MRLKLFLLLLICNSTIAQKSVLNEGHNHIYALPFESGKTILIMQGYNGKYSHKNKFALDFRLRKGKPICAARSGKVIKMVEHNNEGGGNIKYVNKANYVVIDHGDGTYAGYWHLEENGALVEVGDLVKVGDKIGKSGSTGFSTMAHLHFMVYRYNEKGKQQTIPTCFATKKKPCKRLKSYSLVRGK
jgi:murein DD-endopeptidase MepM/ murein hydrolase activator NlpD